MKKFFAVLLVLVLALAMAACGGDAVEEADVVVEEEVAEESEPADSAVTASTEGTDITDEQVAAIAGAYNEVAPVYNEVYTLAETNGWLADELTATELNAVGGTLGVIGQALTEDISMLEGADVDALPGAMLEFLPGLETVYERVSVPYEG